MKVVLLVSVAGAEPGSVLIACPEKHGGECCWRTQDGYVLIARSNANLRSLVDHNMVSISDDGYDEWWRSYGCHRLCPGMGDATLWYNFGKKAYGAGCVDGMMSEIES